MKKFLISILVLAFSIMFIPKEVIAAGASTSGGGAKYIGDTFTINVSVGGANFDSLQGTISVSGPVDVVSFSAGSATWLPGKSPDNGNQFVGIVPATNSLKVATIKLKGKSAGSGAVSVSGVKLALKGGLVGSDSATESFSIAKKPTPPGLIKVVSTSHPDQNASYEATTIDLSWDKPSGVTGFSYAFDQSTNTVPGAKSQGDGTALSLKDQPVGTYYFHIRAQNGDGWGDTTHFKINIKEPDPKIDTTLSKPSDVKIEKANGFINNIKDGTVSGIKIIGKSTPGYTVTATFLPALAIPEGKSLTAVADENGNFEIIIDFPISAGTKKMTLQGQKDKKLTPISDEVTFEVTQAKGGNIIILTENDANAPIAATSQVKGAKTSLLNFDLSNKKFLYQAIAGLIVIIAGIAAIVLYFKRRR